MEAAMDYDGFGFVECLSECVERMMARLTRRTRARAVRSTLFPPITT